MSEFYDDEDVAKAVGATRRVKGGTIVGILVEKEVRWALDAVAPTIVARALREEADRADEEAETHRELADRYGGYYGGVYSTKRHQATVLRDRADAIAPTTSTS